MFSTEYAFVYSTELICPFPFMVLRVLKGPVGDCTCPIVSSEYIKGRIAR